MLILQFTESQMFWYLCFFHDFSLLTAVFTMHPGLTLSSWQSILPQAPNARTVDLCHYAWFTLLTWTQVAYFFWLSELLLCSVTSKQNKPKENNFTCERSWDSELEGLGLVTTVRYMSMWRLAVNYRLKPILLWADANSVEGETVPSLPVYQKKDNG